MFTGESTYGEVLEKKGKKAYEIFAKHNIPCVTCPMARYEMEHLKLGFIAQMYGIDLDALLDDLNKEDE